MILYMLGIIADFVNSIPILFGFDVILQGFAKPLKNRFTIFFRSVAKTCEGTAKIENNVVIIKQSVISIKYFVI